jgi:hypothetical protein
LSTDNRYTLKKSARGPPAASMRRMHPKKAPYRGRAADGPSFGALIGAPMLTTISSDRAYLPGDLNLS